MPLPPGLSYEEAAALGRQIGLPMPRGDVQPQGDFPDIESRLRAMQETAARVQRLAPLPPLHSPPNTEFSQVPADPEQLRRAARPPGVPSATNPPPGVTAATPNPSIPTPLQAPEPRGGLAPPVEQRGSQPAQNILDQMTQGAPWIGPEKRENMSLDFGRSMGLPIPSGPGVDAGAAEEAKQRAELGAQKAALLGKPPPPGVLGALNQMGEYTRLGLEETKQPGFMDPVGGIILQKGVQSQYHPTYGLGYYQAQQAGTPQHDEVDRQAMARQAFLAGLKSLPEMTKLQEAQIHAQQQQAALHKTILERSLAGNPGQSFEQFKGMDDVLRLSDERRRLETGGPLPIVPGAVSKPGLPPPTAEEQRKAALLANAEDMKKAFGNRQEASAEVPDEQKVAQLIETLGSAYTAKALTNALSGNAVVLRHPPTRARIGKAILGQGTKTQPDLEAALEDLILSNARYSGLGEVGLPGAPGGTISTGRLEGGSPFTNKYFVDTRQAVPGGRRMEGQRSIFSPELFQSPVARYRQDAEAAAEILKIYLGARSPR